MAKKLYEERDVARIAGRINSYTGENKAYKLREMADGINEAAEAAADKKEAITAALIDRSIEEIVIPDGVTVLGECAFRECNKLKKVTLPNGLKRIEAMAFYLIKSLEEIEIPEGVEFIGGSAFSGCSNLAKVTLPESITAIGTTVFNGTAITSFVYPDKVERIDDRIFLGCQKLVSVAAPSACLYVEEYAFGKCPLCVTYDFSKCKAVPKLYDVNAFENINPEAKIIVPAKLYKSWIAATNWVEYADYIEPDGPIPSEGLDINELGELVGRGSCTDSVIVVPDEVKTIAMNSFVEDATLDTLILPEREIGVYIYDYSVYGSTLRVIENFYSSASLAILSCPLALVTFLPSVQHILLDSLNLYSGATYDFTRHTEVPVLDATYNYYEVSEGTRFLVPASLYDEWIAATNWTLIQPYIFPVETE